MFLAGAIAWAAALPLAAAIATQTHPAAPLSLAALAVYAAGSIVCHQLPARSFHLWSAQMPVCARCTGVYAGAAIAALCLVRVTRSPRMRPASRTVRVRLAAAALPTLATLAIEWTTGSVPSNSVRALAGLPLGAAVAWAIAAALAPSAHARRVPTASFGETTAGASAEAESSKSGGRDESR
jgi:uncharacterized membrane protein